MPKGALEQIFDPADGSLAQIDVCLERRSP